MPADGYEEEDFEEFDSELSIRDHIEDALDEGEAGEQQAGSEAAQQQPEQAGEQQYSPIDPPARWTKEEKEQFASLDPKVQHILAQRNKGLEAQYTRQFTEMAQERERYRGIEGELASRRQHWARAGMTDQDALRSIMSYWDLAQADPVKFLGTFAQERGIDLYSAFGPTPEELSQLVQAYTGEIPNGNGGAVNPMVQKELQQLRAQQQQLQQTIQWQQQHLTQRQQAEIAETTQAAQGALSSFANAVDESGQSLYPYFEDVRKDMALLMRNGKAETLEQAYATAVRMNGNVWQSLQESSEIARRRADEQRKMEEAARARRAGASISTGTAPATAHQSDDGDEGALSIRDLLKQQFQQAHYAGRV